MLQVAVVQLNNSPPISPRGRWVHGQKQCVNVQHPGDRLRVSQGSVWACISGVPVDRLQATEVKFWGLHFRASADKSTALFKSNVNIGLCQPKKFKWGVIIYSCTLKFKKDLISPLTIILHSLAGG